MPETPPITQPVLTSERLLLRALALGDAPAVATLAGDRRVAETTLLIPHPYKEADAREFAELAERDAVAVPPRQFVWAVLHQDALIGCIGLTFNWKHSRAELGYWIGVPFWGHGFATEAARCVIGWGFEAAALNRIDAHHMAHNPASGRVLEKAGMTREGVVREHVKKDGRFVDGVVYSVLRREWRKHHAWTHPS